MSKNDGHWIEKATANNHGALRATAKHEGLAHGNAPLSSSAVDTLAHSKNATTRHRAQLARTLKKMHSSDIADGNMGLTCDQASALMKKAGAK